MLKTTAESSLQREKHFSGQRVTSDLPVSCVGVLPPGLFFTSDLRDCTHVRVRMFLQTLLTIPIKEVEPEEGETRGTGAGRARPTQALTESFPPGASLGPESPPSSVREPPVGAPHHPWSGFPCPGSPEQTH